MIVVAAEFSDPRNERIIVLMAAGLVLLGIAMSVATVWWWRTTRTEHSSLAPLELMGERSWQRASDADRRRKLDGVRMPGAEPGAPNPEPVDLRALVRSVPRDFDDLREAELAERAELTDANVGAEDHLGGGDEAGGEPGEDARGEPGDDAGGEPGHEAGMGAPAEAPDDEPPRLPPGPRVAYLAVAGDRPPQSGAAPGADIPEPVQAVGSVGGDPAGDGPGAGVEPDAGEPGPAGGADMTVRVGHGAGGTVVDAAEPAGPAGDGGETTAVAPVVGAIDSAPAAAPPERRARWRLRSRKRAAAATVAAAGSPAAQEGHAAARDSDAGVVTGDVPDEADESDVADAADASGASAGAEH